MSIRGPWYVTRKAAREYAEMMFDGSSEEQIEEARAVLVECARSAHFVREGWNGAELWRASSEWHRVGLVVGSPPARLSGGLPALISVLRPHAKWKKAEEWGKESGRRGRL